jgi:glycosyltransferase involved in cell wall biosynthesis
MLFLCEHETQGIACQEAMASNVPVLAWDEGVLVDPMFRKFAPDDFRVTSVPYFDDRCGERFTLPNFEIAFSKFWNNLDGYSPRQYVLERLSLEKCAQAYLAAYGSLMPAR